MDFFFPADVFAAYPHQGHSTRSRSYGAAPGPSTNIFNGCGFDSHTLFADSFIDAIQHERAAYARAQAERARRAEAARRAKVAAARQAAEERQAQAYLQHILEMQQREAQRRYHLEQLHRQRQEAERQRRQQYEEYQRRKAYAIEKERQRIAAARAAQEDESKQLFLALEDLIFGGLNSLFHAQQQDDEDEDIEVELAHKNDNTASAPAPQAIDVKGKAKAEDNNAMDVDNEDSDDTAAAAAAALMAADEDPVEVGPAPTSASATETESAPVSAPAPAPVTKTEQLVFSHAFPSDASFDKTSVRANQINVSVDEAQRKVTVSGLWNDQVPAPIPATSPTVRSASPAPSDSSSRRGRSRSPKRARVSDVDENGEEILAPETNDGDDDFVEVSFTRASPAAAQQERIEKTFDLPHGANVEDLRAELSEEGLKLFTTVSA